MVLSVLAQLLFYSNANLILLWLNAAGIYYYLRFIKMICFVFLHQVW